MPTSTLTRVLPLTLALLCLARLAHGQAPEEPEADEREARAAAARQAGVADQRNEPGGDPQGFEICAATYLEIYNDVETHRHPDALLWNAANCSLAANMAGQAVQIWTTLLDRYPESEHAKSTLLELATFYASIAEYEHAASRLEQFAKQYTKDQHTPDALQNAYLFRLGLGQRDQATRDLGDYERLYAKNDHKRAAGVFWTQRDLLDSWKTQRAHALDYIANYDFVGGIDRLVVAHGVVAQIDWRRSCSEPLLLDTCITIEREPSRSAIAALSATGALSAADIARLEHAKAERAGTASKHPRYRPPTRCGTPDHGIVTVHRRNAKLAADAQQRIDTLMRFAHEAARSLPEDDAARMRDFNDAWGMAMVYRADQQYEALLSLEFPDDLDFYYDPQLRDSGVAAWERKYKQQRDRREASAKRFRTYFSDKSKLLSELGQHYYEVKTTKSPYWMIMAAGRVGMAYQNFADELIRAKLPRGLSDEQRVNAYCEILADSAKPIADQALAAWEYCVERSTQFQYFTPASRVCETYAAALAPTKYPLTHELFGESVYADTRMQAAGLIADPGVDAP